MIIWYFQKSFWPLIKVEIKQRSWDFDSFKKLVEKVVDAKAKAALRPQCYLCKTNQHCLEGSWPSAAKTNIQGQLIKDPRVEEPKSKPQESKVPAL